MKHRKPPNIDAAFTARCRRLAADHDMDIPDGFVLYGCDRRSGRCDNNGRITIPLWLEFDEESQLIQYIAHEIAHAYTWLKSGRWTHSPMFMEFMTILCPEEDWHWELCYRPREARKAGVKEKSGYRYGKGTIHKISG